MKLPNERALSIDDISLGNSDLDKEDNLSDEHITKYVSKNKDIKGRARSKTNNTWFWQPKDAIHKIILFNYWN